MKWAHNFFMPTLIICEAVSVRSVHRVSVLLYSTNITSPSTDTRAERNTKNVNACS